MHMHVHVHGSPTDIWICTQDRDINKHSKVVRVQTLLNQLYMVCVAITFNFTKEYVALLLSGTLIVEDSDLFV